MVKKPYNILKSDIQSVTVTIQHLRLKIMLGTFKKLYNQNLPLVVNLSLTL